MNGFSYLPDNSLYNNHGLFGGAFDEKKLDTAIGLKSDMDVGHINSLFDSIKNPEADNTTKDVMHERDKRDLSSDDSNVAKNSGNSTIWIIVLIVIIVLVLAGFVIYKITKTKKIQEKAKQLYTNLSDKLSSIRDSMKKTAIDS